MSSAKSVRLNKNVMATIFKNANEAPSKPKLMNFNPFDLNLLVNLTVFGNDLVFTRYSKLNSFLAVSLLLVSCNEIKFSLRTASLSFAWHAGYFAVCATC